MGFSVVTHFMKILLFLYHVTLSQASDSCIPDINSLNALYLSRDTAKVTHISLSNVPNHSILKGVFDRFPNLKRLEIVNSRMFDLDQSMFPSSLEFLNLTDNFLAVFDFESIAPNSQLKALDLSQNRLVDIVNFNADNFENLRVFNISQNHMEYLPKEILGRLSHSNDFDLIIQDNLWNCEDEDWKDLMNEVIREIFCGEFAYDPKVIHKKMQTYYSSTNDTNMLYPEKRRCTFLQCIYWVIGAVWIGIILGNVCNIKRLIFRRSAGNTRVELLEEKVAPA